MTRLLKAALLCLSYMLFAGNGPGGLSLYAAASVQVVDLRCEYRVNPLGLDVPKPRLSWRLEATHPQARGQRQTGYQILVSSRQEWLNQNKGDLWDSGFVQSADSINIAYNGQALMSGQECFWKVKVADEQGEISGWSPSARWTTGLFSLNDWKAKWIGTDQNFVKGKGWPPPDNAIPDPWFRKVFELPAVPTRATLYVASVGYHEVYINGQRVGDTVLVPSATDHRHRARYITYEIGPFLKPGRNVLGLWLGVSWSIFPQFQTEDKPKSPIVLAQAELQFTDGSKVQVVTDESWKTHPSPNTLLGIWDFMHFGGELYDANRELPKWCDPGLDDSSWQSVKTYRPALALSSEKAEPNRLIKEIKPVSIKEGTNGTYRVDMGVNFAGWFEMPLSGQPGDRIEFQFSERENEAMTHRLHSIYILGPSGKGVFRNRFNYGVGRWIQISGLKTQPALDQMRGWLIRTDYQRASGFECDQPLLNRIYDTTLWTFENLSLGSYVVDCPQRERMGYGGDAHATTRTALDNYSLGAFYTKWIEDWRDVQGADGNLPYTSPTYWGGGGPGWSGYCITLPWEIYLRYGDQRILEVNFPMMQRWLAFLEAKSANNMLKRWGGEWDFLGDWLWPGAKGVNGDTRETLFFNNCYWIYNLQTAARIADAIGQSEAADKYRARTQQVREAVHSTFYNPADHSYVNGFQAYLAIALVVDLPPQDQRSAVWQRLEKEILVNRKGHIYAGITGGAFLFKALLENHRNDLIYAMVSKEDYPGWGDMLKRGATTFYEDWDCKLSYLHSSYLYVGSWFIEGLGGISHPEKPGFQHFVIEPWIGSQNGPRRVQAHHDSLYGRIATRWTVQDNLLNLNVTVPPNTDALLRLPELDRDSLTESGQSLAQIKGASLVPSDHPGATLLKLQAGTYDFQARLRSQP